MTAPDKAILSLIDSFKPAIHNLYYSSESDYPFELSIVQGDFSNSLLPNVLLQQLGKPQHSPVEVLTADHFFDRLTQTREWHGDQEKAIAQRFQTLAALIQNTLTDIHVYRIGTIEIDIYIVGCVGHAIAPLATPTWIVLSTKAIET